MSYSNSLIFSYVLAAVITPSSITALAEDAGGEGKDEYMTYGCYQCHGTEGQGAITGPRLAPGPLPFESFKQFVRFPPNRMPAYSSEVLDESELKAIYAYITSIPNSQDVNEIPLLLQRTEEISRQ